MRKLKIKFELSESTKNFTMPRQIEFSKIELILNKKVLTVFVFEYNLIF